MQTVSPSDTPARGRPVTRTRPPGPRGLPLIGSALDIRRDALGFFATSARLYGDVVAFSLGSWPMLLLSNPDHIEQVLVRERESFRKHRVFWRQVTAIFGQGLLTSEGENWLRQRRLMASAFTGQRLAAYGETMVRHTERMLDGWRVGETRDLHPEMMALTLGIAAKALFSAEVEQEVAAIDHAVKTLTVEIASRFGRPFVIPDAVPLPGHIRYRRALRRIEAVVERVIGERRLKPGSDAGDLLSTLMAARDDAGRPLSDRQLRDEVITLLLAGHETTALALSWTWYLLGQHAEIEAELAAEVQRVVGGRAVTVADLPNLPFADHVVTEAMRLYPPAWAIGREAVSDCEIGDCAVPAGTTVYMSQWVVQRDPRHFDGPKEFRPERWSGDAVKALPRFAYFPFGGGPRICIGNRFAQMEAVLILATMAQRVRLRWRGERPVLPLPSITLRPAGGVRVEVQARH